MRIEVELPDTARPGQYGVYVARDAEGVILYIGRTKNLYQRLNGHRSQSSWFRDMRAIEFTPCDGANEARLLEKLMIAQESPAANVVDRLEPKRCARQSLPDWTVAKLVGLHEACEDSNNRHNDAENERLNNYILALRLAGWTLQAVAFALSMSREGVRLRELRATRPDSSLGVPAVPVRVKATRTKKVRPTIPEPTLGVLLELKAQAMQVRGWTPLDSPLRDTSERYSEMLAEQYLNGVAVSRIAKQLGVTPLAIRARLARHGYLPEVKGLPNNVAYGERVWVRERTHCKAGHPLSGDNLRLIKGDPKKRVCIACDRRRAKEYLERKRAERGAA